MQYAGEIIRLFSIIALGSALLLFFFSFLKEAGIIRHTPFERFTVNCHAHSLLNSVRKKMSPDMKLLLTIALLVLSTHIILHLIGYLGFMLVKNERPGLFNSFMLLWNRWDADHYLKIAQNWYVNHGDARNFIVFYPLYPILIRLVNVAVNSYFWSGILVSNLSLVAACFYLFKLVQMDYGRAAAFRSVKYLLFFPVSFFLGSTFSESLFISLSIMMFYYIRRDKWVSAAICGMFAALTRSLGLLLFVPFFIELVVRHRVFFNIIHKQSATNFKVLARRSICLLAFPMTFFIYLYINKAVTGDWFTFLQIQKEHWSQTFGFFADNLENYTKNIFTWEASHSASLWTPEVVLIVISLIIIVFSASKLRSSYSGYMLAYMLMCISATWLLSAPRYIMGMFPIYIILSLLGKNKIWDTVITFASLVMLGFCTIAYTAGFHIM